MPDTRAPMPSPEALAERGYALAVGPISSHLDVHDDPDEFLERFAQVTEAQGLLLAAHWAQSEICNGGHHQFFSNPTGVLAPEAIRGFQLLGLKDAGALLTQAVLKFPSPYPRDPDERNQVLQDELEGEGSARSEWDPFYELDKQFYKVASTEAFTKRADHFVSENLELFFR